jgi:solute carrier family 25 protein 38
MLPPKELESEFGNNFIRNGQQAYKYILKHDGMSGFFKGMIAATLKAGTGSYIYFAILRELEKEDQSAFQNFWTSSVARILSTFFTNPLSIIETRFELADFHMYKNVHGAVADIYRKEGMKGFFSGALASCLKEGFFGGMYYMIYDELKTFGMAKFPAGIIGGMLATSISHPLEIIRARLQTIGLTEKHELS